MRFSRKTLGLLLVTAASTAVTASISTSTVALSSVVFGLEKKSGLFGIKALRNNSGDIVTSIARGGASAEDDGDGDDAEEDIVEEPQVLYLPGLLEVNVAKKAVCKLHMNHDDSFQL